MVAEDPAPSADVKKKTPIEELFGSTLLANLKTKKDTVSLLKDKKFVLVYFSAHWCPPCQAFTPVLKSFYERVKGLDANLIEIVYISSDRSIEEFEEYYGGMPWLAMGTDAESTTYKSGLASRLKIQSIPSLIVLEASTGNFITSSARAQVMNMAVTSAEECTKMIQNHWATITAVPIDEADMSGRGGGIMAIVTFLSRNPMYILGLFYGVKWLYKTFYIPYQQAKLAQLGGGDAADMGATDGAADMMMDSAVPEDVVAAAAAAEEVLPTFTEEQQEF